jgi:hypothetical protein
LEGKIDEHINSANVILLLISNDSLSSKSCQREQQRARDRYEAGEALVIPVMLRPVHWQHEWFARILMLPTDGRSVTAWSNRDEAFVDVANGLSLALSGLDRNPRSGQDMTDLARRTEECANPDGMDGKQTANSMTRADRPAITAHGSASRAAVVASLGVAAIVLAVLVTRALVKEMNKSGNTGIASKSASDVAPLPDRSRYVTSAEIVLPKGGTAAIPDFQQKDIVVNIVVDNDPFQLQATDGSIWVVTTRERSGSRLFLAQENGQARAGLYGFGVCKDGSGVYVDGLQIDGKATRQFTFEFQPGVVRPIEIKKLGH